MKTLAALLTMSCLGFGASVRADDAQLEQLAWLAGCWSAEGGEPGTVEHWLPLAGGTLIGVSRTVKGGKTIAHEFMQVRRSDAGQIVFIALPSGQSETTFVLKSLDTGSVTFENPAHDFPQRVIYRRTSPDRIVGRIDGVRGGNLQGIDFPLRRIACDPA